MVNNKNHKMKISPSHKSNVQYLQTHMEKLQCTIKMGLLKLRFINAIMNTKVMENIAPLMLYC